MRMHGVPDANELCATCAQPRRAHRNDVDANGWYECRRRKVELPDDWPEFDGAAAWSNLP